MKALILSGGMGKRLRPITDYLPKPLVPIDGIPIIDWQIKYFKKFGIKEFVICTGYHSDQIADHLSQKKLNVNIQFSIEKTSLGTGGAIKNASKLLDEETFYVINGDVITNLDLKKLRMQKNSIAVVPLRTAFGIVHLAGNRVQRFEEKPKMSHYWINAGLYYLEKDIIKLLPTIGNIEATVFPKLADMNNLYATKYERAFWHSIDSHKDIEECTKEMKSVRYDDFLSTK
ncbi:MAG: nucleotidyltransferase family protein [Nitrosotalea sp.]